MSQPLSIASCQVDRDARDVNFGLVPLLPNPRVVEERDTKSITALLTVKHLNESGDETEDLIGGSSRSTAVKS